MCQQYSAAANSWIMNDNYLICSRSGNPPNKTSKTKPLKICHPRLPHHRSPLLPTTFGANLSASGRQHFIRNIIHQHHGQFPNKMSNVHVKNDVWEVILPSSRHNPSIEILDFFSFTQRTKITASVNHPIQCWTALGHHWNPALLWMYNTLYMLGYTTTLNWLAGCLPSTWSPAAAAVWLGIITLPCSQLRPSALPTSWRTGPRVQELFCL